jgi:hypothetical protein
LHIGKQDARNGTMVLILNIEASVHLSPLRRQASQYAADSDIGRDQRRAEIGKIAGFAVALRGGWAEPKIIKRHDQARKGIEAASCPTA